MKIVILDRETLTDGIKFKPLPAGYELVEFTRTFASEVSERIRDADIVVSNKVTIKDEHLEGATKLKWIAVAATGFNIIDLPACQKRGIQVSNIRNYATNCLPEQVFALIFGLSRSVIAYHDSIRRGRWTNSTQFSYFDYPVLELHGKTLGIVGAGVLGQKIATIAQAFGMKVLFASRKGQPPKNPSFTPFEEVIAQVDVLTLHVPLSAETKNLIAAPEFAQMKDSALLINTARGGVVNEEDLVHALLHKQIAGAAFDVLTTEPMPFDHPFYKLMHLPNFILSPHLAWLSPESVQTLADQLVDQMHAFAAGKLFNVVCP